MSILLFERSKWTKPFALITILIEQEVYQPSEAIFAALALAIAIESGADTRNRKKGRLVALLFHA